MGAISQLGAEKITFPLNVVDIHTDRWTDICFYGVALLLKKSFYEPPDEFLSNKETDKIIFNWYIFRYNRCQRI